MPTLDTDRKDNNRSRRLILFSTIKTDDSIETKIGDILKLLHEILISQLMNSNDCYYIY